MILLLGEGLVGPWLAMLGAALIVIWWLMGWTRRRRLANPPPTAAEQLERLKQARGVRGDLDEAMVEVQQVARRMSAQLEAQALRLEQLIGQADQRIAKLESMSKHQADAPIPTPAPPPPALPPDPLTRRVHQLADAGLTAPQIAAELHEHTGKIELILALRSVR